MIKLLIAKPAGDFQIEMEFSDSSTALFDGKSYLATRQGPLLDGLRDAAYFNRFFIDAGALCWPNGLELSAARLHSLAKALA